MSTPVAYWTVAAATDDTREAVRFAIADSTLKGVRKGRAAVKAALAIMGVETLTDTRDVVLADPELGACVTVMSPDGRYFIWRSASPYVRLVGAPK